MKNLGQMMKQAQKFQDKMAEMQTVLEAEEITGAAGGGLIKATLNGKGDVKAVRIDPSLVDPDDIEMLEDLIVAACADAKSKVEANSAEKMSTLTAGLNLPPGMKLPF